MNFKAVAFALAACATLSLQARADVITFDDDAAMNHGGFTLDTHGMRFADTFYTAVFDYASSAPAGAFNGTPQLIAGFAPIELTKIGGGSFHLGDIDLGLSWYNYGATQSVTVAATLLDGSTASQDFTLTHEFQTLNLSMDVTSVRFAGAAFQFGYVAFDNLHVDDFALGHNDQIAAVPEPGTWALMFAGLLSIGTLSARARQLRTRT